MDIKAEISHYLEECHSLKRKGIHLTENTLLLEEKIVDSLGMLELISFVEETFDVEVRDEDISPEHFGTIKKLAGFLESRIKMSVGND